MRKASALPCRSHGRGVREAVLISIQPCYYNILLISRIHYHLIVTAYSSLTKDEQVRNFHDIDLESMNYTHYDGRNLL